MPNIDVVANTEEFEQRIRDLESVIARQRKEIKELRDGTLLV